MKKAFSLWKMRILVEVLRRLQRIQFPQRRFGDDEWVYRWRLNFLLNRLEPETVLWARRMIRPGMVVLDVGAHLGYYSRLFSKWVGPTGRVFAFEPCSENFDVLMHNLSSRRYRNVTLLRQAVGASVGQGILHLSPGHSNHSLYAGFTQETGQELVELVSLDAFMEKYQLPAVDFIKIDVEGAEIEVLQGMRNLVSRSPSLCMVVEYNPFALQAANFQSQDLLLSLSDLGFTVHLILPDGWLTLAISSEMNQVANLFCCRK